MFINSLLNILAPYSCLSCSIEGELLCGWCKVDAIPLVPPRCYLCRSQSLDFATCNSCCRGSRLKNVWVASEYSGTPKILIHMLKFGRTMTAADEIAEQIKAVLPYLPPETIITFVPTATGRRRMRGYDQSELIAKRLAKLLGCRFKPLLLRQGQTRQVGASRTKRRDQIAGALRPRALASIKGASVLLVDDIVTTGATLEAAARVLKQAKAKRITAAVFAQKL